MDLLSFFPSVSCHSFYSKRYSRALYLGAKAIQLNSNSVQALLLKGAALRNMGRVQEAIIHFREAMRLAPCRLDCYEGTPSLPLLKTTWNVLLDTSYLMMCLQVKEEWRDCYSKS